MPDARNLVCRLGLSSDKLQETRLHKKKSGTRIEFWIFLNDTIYRILIPPRGKTMKKGIVLFCFVALFAVLFSSCPSGLVEDSLAATLTPKTIFDGAHADDANQHFYFLPPMVSQPTYSGTFDGSLSPVVEISGPGLSDPVVFTMESGRGSQRVRVAPEDEHYMVNWHTGGLYDPDTENVYRITVLVDGYELGYADVQLVNSGRKRKSVDTGEYVSLKDGSTLPVKFRIEKGWHVVPIEGLVAYYPFNGNARDASGYGNDGTIYGATLSADRFGNDNSSYCFDGLNDYIDVAHADIFDFTDQITLTAWIKPVEVSGTYVITKSAYASGGAVISLDIYPGKTRAIFRKPGSSSTFGAVGATEILPDVWQHVAVTWDGSIVKVFYNGLLDATGTYSGQMEESTGSFSIGLYPGGAPPPYFNGCIDEIRIFTRALSETEILEEFEN